MQMASLNIISSLLQILTMANKFKVRDLLSLAHNIVHTTIPQPAQKSAGSSRYASIASLVYYCSIGIMHIRVRLEQSVLGRTSSHRRYPRAIVSSVC